MLFRTSEEYDSAEENTPHLQMSVLQTEDPCTPGKRTHRDPLSKVQHYIYQEKLGVIYVRIYCDQQSRDEV